jgi:hypothetical protein
MSPRETKVCRILTAMPDSSLFGDEPIVQPKVISVKPKEGSIWRGFGDHELAEQGIAFSFLPAQNGC